MHKHVVAAIFRRNFLSYFNNPTGYVFIGLFVVLSSFAAFWPNEFFNANLANLDQLNRYLPVILLLFIPAITMAIWADERRQGTDELLLTIPASDFDVVLGKFLAAVAVYSVALLFSLICNLLMLRALGRPDVFLFLANYIGYWLVGLAMLATGMVASFLTGNLTVSFILGVVFNAPLVLLDYSDMITGSAQWTLSLKQWGLAEQFSDFGRGVISLSATIYFLAIVVVMLYLCLVMIGRRHWLGGRDGSPLLGHYLVRAGALGVAAVAVVLIAQSFDLRRDVTLEQISSLSPDTIKLVHELELDTKGRAVQIEAYVSPSVPENLVQVRLNLLNDLRELSELGGRRIQVRIITTEPSTAEAANAEQQFGIKPQTVMGRSRGASKDEQVFLGVAVTCGLEKVVVPFFDTGTPLEYELIRAIATAAKQKRKRLGIVRTDAQLFGGIEMGPDGRPSMQPRQAIVDELEKQYEVIQVDASKPIEKFDVLMVVQPSSLDQGKVNNLIEAIRAGQPTAIFEDPWIMTRSFAQSGVVGTTQEKGGNPMTGMPGGPKADISALWSLLGVRIAGKDRSSLGGPGMFSAGVVWQNFNPYPKLSYFQNMPREFVFVQPGEPGVDEPAFNPQDPITSGLQELWFPGPGAVTGLRSSKLKFVPLVNTGNRTGLVPSDELQGPRDSENPEDKNKTNENYTLAAHITGELPEAARHGAADKSAADADKKGTDKNEADKKDTAAKASDKSDAEKGGSAAAAAAAKARAARLSHPLDVVLVMDIDLMEGGIFELRSQAAEEEFGVHFDNVVFVANLLDELAGEKSFIEIRKRRPAHRTLETIDQKVNKYREDLADARNKADDQFKEKLTAAQAEGKKVAAEFQEIQAKVADATRRGEQPSEDLLNQYKRAGLSAVALEAKMEYQTDKLKRNHQHELEQLDRELHTNVREVQNWYKAMAVLIPPILPLIVAVFVFFSRRAQEREGVARSRLR